MTVRGSGWMCTRAVWSRACLTGRAGSCGVCGRPCGRRRRSSGWSDLRRRCGLPTRRGRLAMGSRVPARLPGSCARSRRRRRSRGRLVTGSRPTGATPSGSRGLLRLGELVAVRVPEPHEEAGRDLVRAREDARGELMRARHRLSKLLLRYGLVYDAKAWTLAHDAWLRRQRFDARPLAVAFEEAYAGVLASESAPRQARPGDRRAGRAAAVCRDRRPAVLSARRRHADRACVDRRARRLDAFPTASARPVPRTHAERGLKRRASPTRRDHQDRQHARAPAARGGRLAPAPPLAGKRRARAAPTDATSRCPCACRPQCPPPAHTLARARSARQTTNRRRRRGRARARRPLLGTRNDVTHPPDTARRGERSGEKDARSDPRDSYERPAMGHTRH